MFATQGRRRRTTSRLRPTVAIQPLTSCGPTTFRTSACCPFAAASERGKTWQSPPFSEIPSIAGHESLLAVADSPDDRRMAPIFREAVPHVRLVRFDTNVGQRNVTPVLVALDGWALEPVAGDLSDTTEERKRRIGS